MNPYLRKLRRRYQLANIGGCVCSVGAAVSIRSAQTYDSWWPVFTTIFFTMFLLAAFGERRTFYVKIRELLTADTRQFGPASPFADPPKPKPPHDSFWR